MLTDRGPSNGPSAIRQVLGAVGQPEPGALTRRIAERSMQVADDAAKTITDRQRRDGILGPPKSRISPSELFDGRSPWTFTSECAAALWLCTSSRAVWTLEHSQWGLPEFKTHATRRVPAGRSDHPRPARNKRDSPARAGSISLRVACCERLSNSTVRPVAASGNSDMTRTRPMTRSSAIATPARAGLVRGRPASRSPGAKSRKGLPARSAGSRSEACPPERRIGSTRAAESGPQDQEAPVPRGKRCAPSVYQALGAGVRA